MKVFILNGKGKSSLKFDFYILLFDCEVVVLEVVVEFKVGKNSNIKVIKGEIFII